MKRFSEQLHKKSETVKLRAAEKRALRERVVSYMEYHPLPATAKTKRVFADRSELTEAYRIVHIPFSWLARVGASVAVLVFIVVPVMAERAVPGDSLYAVKVRFNEEVRSSLAFSTSEKVAWETERLNRRIAEARLLASEGKLTEEVEATVVAEVRSQSDEVQRNIAILRNVDADEATLASIAFETTLEVQSASLRKSDDTEEVAVMAMMAMRSVPESEPTADNSLSSVLEESRAKASASNASSTIPAFPRIMARVEQNTTRIYELLDSITDTVPTERLTEVTRRASDIERAIVEATALQTQDDMSARQALLEVLQRTQRLIVYMTELAVAEQIDLEDIVPVVLTEAEEQSGVKQYRARMQNLIEQIENALTDETIDSGVREKAQTALDDLIIRSDAVASSTEYALVKAEATVAEAIATDILGMLSLTPVATPDIEPEIIDVASTSASTTVDRATSTESTATTSSQVDS